MHFEQPEMITAGELLSLKLPERRPIIRPWLREAETAIIWAASGVGKTMVSISLACVAAGGGRVGRWTCERPNRVLYIDGEMHIADIQDRVRELTESGAAEVADLAAMEANLYFASRQAQKPLATFYDITDSYHQERIMERLLDERIDMVIVDNLATTSDRLRDENDAAAFKNVQAFFLALKQAGVAAILVHHSRKDGGTMRGSSALETTFEVIMGLHRGKNAGAGAARFNVKFSKFRGKGSEALEPHMMTLTETGWVVDEAEVEDAAADEVLQAVRSCDCTSQAELAAVTGLSQGTVSKRLAGFIAKNVTTQQEIDECFATARRARNAQLQVVT